MGARSQAIINKMSYREMGQQLLTALPEIYNRKFKKPGLIAGAIINRWYGKHDTSAWDKL